MGSIGNSNANGSQLAFNADSVVPFFLDGKLKMTDSTFEIVSPLDHKVAWKCSSASEEDAIAAVESAQRAFKSWGKTKPNFRRDILLKAAELFQREKEASQQYSNIETGAQEGMFAFEYELAIQNCLAIAGLISAVQGKLPVVAEEGSSAMLLREPYGVVLGIAPWNAPHVLGSRAFLAAIAAGNCVVLKGPESSPATYWNMVNIMHEAGLPGGVLNTIYHRPADASKITTTLISHPLVKKVNFTGSTGVGAIIASLCGKNLKPCLMELGGKAPSIVCADANLDTASFQCALGAFLHAGQICMSTERIIVEKSIAEDFKKKLAGAMDQVFKEPAQLVASAPVKKNKQLVDDAISKGAEAIYGDITGIDESNTRMKPIILGGIKESMSIYHTESFGPTVSVYEIDASGEQFEKRALELANDTDYGLSSAIFTEDLRKGLRMAKEIETGAVHINSMSVHDEAALAHGGAKKSGFGRFNSIEGLEEWTRTKVVTWKD